MLRCSDYQKEKKTNFAYNMKTQLEIEIEKMMSGQLYDANYNDQLLPLL